MSTTPVKGPVYIVQDCKVGAQGDNTHIDNLHMGNPQFQYHQKIQGNIYQIHFHGNSSQENITESFIALQILSTKSEEKIASSNCEKKNISVPAENLPGKGLSFQIACKNKDCSAKNKKIWITSGFNHFNINKLINLIFCSICNIKPKIKGPYVYCCIYSYNGRSNNTEIVGEKILAEQCVRAINKKSKWSYLEITTEKINANLKE